MGEFGWAYISGSAPLQSAGGVSGSIQYATPDSRLAGSSRLRFKGENNTLELTGTLKVVGAITASSYHIEDITNLNAAGSTSFGNTTDDTHLFTGSMHIKGPVGVTGSVAASHFIGNHIGDGSALTNLPAATGVTHANSGQFRLVTSVDATSIQGEANLTWESSNLEATGSIWASAQISGSQLYGDGQNVDNLNASEITHGTLDNARLPSAISVTSLAGDGAGITGMNASRMTAGTLPTPRLPTIPNGNLPSEVSVTTVTGSTGLSGSVIFGQTAKFSRDLTVQGTLHASRMNVSATGDTIIGDNNADQHQFTGSVYFKGPVSASTGVSASVLIGDGSQITNLPPYGSPAIATYNNAGQYRLVTSVDSNTVQGEAGLSWQSANLKVTGSVWASGQISGSGVRGGGLTAVNEKVGIGEVNPDTTLHAVGNSGLTLEETAGTGRKLIIEPPTAATVGTIRTDDTGAGLLIKSYNAGNQIFLKDDGNVGIGTNTPDTLLHVKSTSAGKPVLKIENQQGGANPVSIQMVRDTSTPAADDAIGQIDFRSKNDADDEKLYAYITGKSTDVTSTNEDGEIQLFTMQGGALVPVMTLQSGKVGVGTQDPEGKLHVYSGEASIAPSALADELVVEGAGSTGISILTPNNQVGRLYFGDSDNSARAYILYDHSIDMMKFSVASANRLVINNAGNVGIGHSYPENPDHKLAVIGDISASVNVSASAFYGDGSNLSNVGGTLTVKEEGVNLTTEATSINFIGAYVTASNSGTDVTVTVNAGAGGGTGRIGAAEDGSYADGLFTDFTNSTTVGTAVDKFNEVLKILAPSPAPGVQHIGVTTGNGTTAKLSFGAAGAIGGVTSHGTAAGWTPAVDRNESYAPATDGYKRKLGVYQNSDITGIINYDIAASITNGNYAYREDSFGNGDTGTLKLEVNGSVVHSIDLSSFTGAGTPPNGTDDTGVDGDGSGFVDVSTASSTLDGNGADWGAIFKYRSAKYIVKAATQRAGWNYLRVIHTVGGTDATSNYIEWINDTDTNPLKVFIPRIEDVSLIGSKYLSGVKYNTDATANYKANLNNMYRNVYPNAGTPISFTATNSPNPSSVAVAAIGGGEDNTKIIQLTASLDCNTNALLNGSISCNLSATHPIKSNINNTGSATASGFLIDNRTLASDWNTENFHSEAFRKTSGSYDTQDSTNAAASVWNSQTHMLSDAGYDDGLMEYNQALMSPLRGPNSGNFSTLTNGPGGNPNYSGVSGTRTFFRVLSASTGQAYDVRITANLDSTTINNSALGTGNVHIFVKVPGTTGWMNAAESFTYGEITDDAGALNPTATNTPTVKYLTFGTASVANNENIMFKVVADASWTGHINQIEFAPNVSTATNAPALTAINIDQTGTNAKLSFGTSNAVGSYQPVTGSGLGSMSTINSNGAYTASGNRRAVFSSSPTVTGDINGDGTQFRNAYDGNLILEVNGIEVHSVNLHTLTSIPAGGGYDANGNGSGFDLSTLAWRQGPANANDYRYPYRTGTYTVAAADQRLGWNTVRVIHRTGGGDTVTTYAQWVVDTDGTTMASSSVNLPDFYHDELYYQSGVGYFAQQPSSSFALAASNVYRNVYWNGSSGITFPTATRCTVTNTRAEGSGVTTLDAAGNSKALPALNNSANCEQQILNITGNVRYNSTDSIVDGLSLFTAQDIFVNCLVKHPLKANLQTTTYTKDNFMYHSGSLAGTTNINTREDFQLESYRITANNYANQAAVTNASQAWVSSRSVNDPAHTDHEDGMVTIKGYLISPIKIGNAGDTRNVAQGGSLQAPNGNPNYSTGGLTNATRTYYRYFKNESGVAAATPTITLYGDANIVAKSGAFYTGALGANKNINVEIKVPYDPSFTGLDDASTAWGDCVKPYSAGVQPTSDGVGIYNGGGSGLNQTVGGSGRAIALQLQQSMIRNNQYVVVKITAHKDWTGHLSRIDIAY